MSNKYLDSDGVAVLWDEISKKVDLGITDAQPDLIIAIDQVDNDGAPTKWKTRQAPAYPLALNMIAPPTTTTYELGDVFDKTGMQLQCYYSTGHVYDLDNENVTISPARFNTVGTQNVTISYREDPYVVSTTQQVTVTDIAADTWEHIQTIIDVSDISDYINIGDQIIDPWYANSNTSYNAPWDMVHVLNDGSLAVKWHYGIPTDIQFDAPEAIYYAPTGGLAAGQYYITIGIAYSDGWIQGQNINFTLNLPMEAGDQLFIDCGTDAKNNPTNGRTWRVYAKGGTVAKETGVTSNSSTGTLLGSTSSSHAGKTNGLINAPQRVVYGYGRWSQSAIRQYLNSDAAIGDWWEPQNDWDRPPSQLSSVRGFLAGCSADLLSVLQETEVVTALNTVEGFTETTETTMDKIFLPSLQEMYINPQLANVEGVDWDYFETLALDAGLEGKFQQYGTYEILKTFRISSTSSAVYARLRSAYRGTAYYAWYVNTSGYVGNSYASNSYSGCPAAILKKQTNNN